jgi:hypothetical protein
MIIIIIATINNAQQQCQLQAGINKKQQATNDNLICDTVTIHILTPKKSVCENVGK